MVFVKNTRFFSRSAILIAKLQEMAIADERRAEYKFPTFAFGRKSDF